MLPTDVECTNARGKAQARISLREAKQDGARAVCNQMTTPDVYNSPTEFSAEWMWSEVLGRLKG